MFDVELGVLPLAPYIGVDGKAHDRALGRRHTSQQSGHGRDHLRGWRIAWLQREKIGHDATIGCDASEGRFRQLGPAAEQLLSARGLQSHRSKIEEALPGRRVAVNLGGVYRCIRCALPDMLEAGRGRIVNIASTAGLTGYAYVTAYCAAKHGVIGLTRSLAMELARKNITVNAVCPGYSDTDMVRDAVANIQAKTGRDEAAARTALTARNPQGRLIAPEEVAQTVLWLCSSGASSITGQSIAVAGGELM